MSATNQKQFYQELDSCSNIPNEAPDAQKTSEFWNNIWSIPRNFNEKASWLPKVKERLSEIKKQEDIKTSVENEKTAIRKMTNWKALGPDWAQGYWLTEHLQTCVVVGDAPTWITKGKATLIHNETEKGNAASLLRAYHLCRTC